MRGDELLTQSERARYLMQMRWLINRSPALTEAYTEGYDLARQAWWIREGKPVQRRQLAAADGGWDLAYRLGWNDRLDELYRDLRVCGKCGVQYTKTEELIHRCRIL